MALVNGVNAARYVGLGGNRNRFYALVNAGVIPVFVDPITGTKRYSTESLDAWLASFQPLPKSGAA